MLTMIETERLAKISIKKHLKNSSYLTDENIGLVMDYIIRAQLTWKEDGGASLKTHMYNAARGATLVLKRNRYKKTRKHIKTLSLDYEILTNSEYKPVVIKKLIADKSFYNSELKVIADGILESKLLTETERDCIKRHYIDKETVYDISMDKGVSKQAVDQAIERGIKKLRERYNTSAKVNKV